MAGKGRPPANKPKVIDAKARITEEENRMLEFCCQELGMSRSDVLRAGIKKVYDDVVKEKYKKRK